MCILASPMLIATILAPVILALGYGAYAQPSGVNAAASNSGSDREPQLRKRYG